MYQADHQSILPPLRCVLQSAIGQGGEPSAAQTGTQAATQASASKLYYPYRSLGVITDGVPFVLNRRGEECFVTTSVGKSFQVRGNETLTAACLTFDTAGT